VLNTFAKFLLVSTSLSPLLGAVAVNQFARGEPMGRWGAWLVAALLLVFLCWALLRYSAKNAQQHAFRIKEFERNDKEVLAFLVTYLLPFLSTDKMGFTGSWLTGAYVLAIIFLVIAHAGAFHFNPVMGLLGYHFYAVKNDDGISHLLISKEELRRPGKDVPTVRLAHNLYLHTGGADA
jgi:MFS family permease